MNLSPELHNASLANRQDLQYSPEKKALLPYPVTSFPQVLLNVIQELHKNTQIPVALIGNVVLATTSLACQSLIEVIQPHTNMPEPCSLYLMTIAESGEGKTTINKQVMKPCYTFAAELIQQYEQQVVDYKHKLKVWKIRQQALESNLRQAIKKGYPGENEEHEVSEHAQNEPQRPSRPNFIYEDTSLKALVEGLSEHPEAGFISDEAITFFKSYLKNNPGLLNKAWDGEMFDFRRADREIYQITPLLTFSLMSQPGIFNDYIKKHEISARASGFLSRFLFAWVESSIGSRQNTHEKMDADSHLDIFHKRVEEILELNKLQLNVPGIRKKQLTLTDNALTFWRNNRTETERKISPGNEWEHIRDIASKSSANIIRIAALLSFFCDEKIETIDSNSISCATDIMDWYLNQASNIFYPMSERCQFEQDVRELHTWIMRRIVKNEGFAILKNQLEKYGPHRLRRTEKLTPVLNQLISQGVFSVIQAPSGSALYVTIVQPNGWVNPLREFSLYSPCTVIQSRENTQGRLFHVSLK
ncbi:YfjI family protein [Pluralibacter gergoviae]|jgi:hypothetical protein|uniref:YfjI family protein n=1 Tax=Enterobacteriaceae TaxID=543 RepID=UPI00069DBC7C|nr:YfjI family protein [Pluralibacter gergoviae]HCT4798328.1 DUF3987 domain-containing protein [Klebsiella michiganensis]